MNRADIPYLLIAILFLLIPGITHIALAASFHPTDLQLVTFIFTPILTVLNLILLVLTSMLDPGYMPRYNSILPQPNLENEAQILEINGKTLSRTECKTCKIMKPLRAHHCKVSDRCVERLDHHCPWVANCVGVNNQKMFVLLLGCLEVECLFVMLECVGYLARDDKAQFFVGEILLILYVFIMFWSLGGLFLYQVYLVSKNTTTHEQMRKLFGATGNPFNVGISRNCTYFWRMKRVNIVSTIDLQVLNLA